MSTVKEKIKAWVREEAEVMDTYDAHEDSALFGYRLAIVELRKRAPRELGMPKRSGWVRAADHLEAALIPKEKQDEQG